FFLFFIIRNFIQPIRFLVGLIRKVQLGGLLPVADHLERKDEVGQLARGYNVMIDRIKDLIDAVLLTEKEKSRTEMQMLIHQMNPHLLYNILETIKWEADAADQQS